MLGKGDRFPNRRGPRRHRGDVAMDGIPRTGDLAKEERGAAEGINDQHEIRLIG